MKALIAFLFAFALGLLLVVAVAYYNPLYTSNDSVPVNADSPGALELRFGPELDNAIIYSNSGLERLPRTPESVEELWHPSLRGAHVVLHAMQNAQGETVGLGVKMGAWSEGTRVLKGKLLMNSVWSVLMPQAGSFYVVQTENYWPFAQQVVLPATLNDDKTWTGRFAGDTTVGPQGTLEGVFIGGNGVLRGHRGGAKESVRISSYAMGAQHTTATDTDRSSLTILRDPSGTSSENPSGASSENE